MTRSAADNRNSDLKLLRAVFWSQVFLWMISLTAVFLTFYGANRTTSMWGLVPSVAMFAVFTIMLPITYKRWQQARSSPVDNSAGHASLEVQRRSRRLGYYMLFLMPILVAFNLLPFTIEPWIWIKVVILWTGVIILGVSVTRFSLWQRDEYWRERGKDPRHPERPASPDTPSK
ncbi:hypothetical protein [Arthrobacter sp. efr-133-TYG-118]|uniref:hypothetical protein n=1 Tax=Arthrobacter sp. efr-133-TYG-118 TaxID=3040279 RepID=UPI00254B8977|nr:hypothetical protein [Arthrobacter sp. efr-133-TYG-118]